jgi:hypothetical protein
MKSKNQILMDHASGGNVCSFCSSINRDIMKSLSSEEAIKVYVIKKIRSGTVAHTCNTSYLGSRDWEDHSSRPAWAKS